MAFGQPLSHWRLDAYQTLVIFESSGKFVGRDSMTTKVGFGTSLNVEDFSVEWLSDYADGCYARDEIASDSRSIFLLLNANWHSNCGAAPNCAAERFAAIPWATPDSTLQPLWLLPLLLRFQRPQLCEQCQHAPLTHRSSTVAQTTNAVADLERRQPVLRYGPTATTVRCGSCPE